MYYAHYLNTIPSSPAPLFPPVHHKSIFPYYRATSVNKVSRTFFFEAKLVHRANCNKIHCKNSGGSRGGAHAESSSLGYDAVIPVSERLTASIFRAFPGIHQTLKSSKYKTFTTLIGPNISPTQSHLSNGNRMGLSPGVRGQSEMESGG